jgi:hypothetical protein
MGGDTISVVVSIGILVAIVVGLLLYYYRCDLFKAGCDKCKWNIFWTAACPASPSPSPSPSPSTSIPPIKYAALFNKNNLIIKSTGDNKYLRTPYPVITGSPGPTSDQVTLDYTTGSPASAGRDYQYYFNFVPNGTTDLAGHQLFYIVPSAYCYGTCLGNITATWTTGPYAHVYSESGILKCKNIVESSTDSSYIFYMDGTTLKSVGDPNLLKGVEVTSSSQSILTKDGSPYPLTTKTFTVY